MPALKMKSKPTMGYTKDGPNLHVSHNSTKISKGSYVQVKTSQEADAPDAYIQISCEASSNHEVFDDCITPSEAVECRDSCAGASDQFSDFPLVSPNSTLIGRNVQTICPSILETIFSPVLEHDENEGKPTIDGNEGVEDDHADLPHLVPHDSDNGSRSSSGYQSCSFSDHSISNLTIPGFPIDRNVGFCDLISSVSPDYDHIDSNLAFEMEERYMMLPLIEGDLEFNNFHNNYSEEFVVNMEDPCLYLTIHQLKPSEHDTEVSFGSGDVEDAECLDPCLFIRIHDMSEEVPSICPLGLQNEMEKKPVTLVLDLDETLVHSTLDDCDDADFSFLVFFNMKEHIVYVRQRPYLHMFLERVAQLFEIVIFTASQSIYAEKLIDILDPNKKLISHRIYRESCVFSEGSYTKDLTVLGLDLAKVAIIDNSPQVFRLQVNNGIPIKSWFDDPSDNALISLLPFLETLVDAEDVRPIIARKFNDKEQ